MSRFFFVDASTHPTQCTQLDLGRGKGEVRKFDAGSYSLVLDTDASLQEEALDIIFYCTNATKWNPEHGGLATYLV